GFDPSAADFFRGPKLGPNVFRLLPGVHQPGGLKGDLPPEFLVCHQLWCAELKPIEAAPGCGRGLYAVCRGDTSSTRQVLTLAAMARSGTARYERCSAAGARTWRAISTFARMWSRFSAPMTRLVTPLVSRTNGMALSAGR